MKKYFIFILLHYVLLGNYSGGAPGSSFKYGASARGVALSQSTVSISNSGFNAFNNPAFLPNISKDEFGFSFFSMSLDRSIQSFSIARPLPPSAGVGLSVFRSGTDDIISTNDFGTSLGSISQSEGFGMLSFGINLGSLSGGFNIKAYFNNLDNYSGNGIGFDFGFLYNLNEKIDIGLKINNAGGSYSWDIDSEQYEEDISTSYSIGFSFNDNKNLLITSQIDIMSVKENINSDRLYNIYRMGFEYGLDFYKSKNIPIMLRCGIKSIDNKILYSLGFGFPINISKKIKLHIDYALDPGLVEEGFSHLFSFTLGSI
ncbi:hypothetical protein OAQ87_00250 [Candidatus Marinimicrobia bacterium]|nr:hypothetical protein [Candidatus Neomarinimicrobiota bacterium]